MVETASRLGKWLTSEMEQFTDLRNLLITQETTYACDVMTLASINTILNNIVRPIKTTYLSSMIYLYIVVYGFAFGTGLNCTYYSIYPVYMEKNSNNYTFESWIDLWSAGSICIKELAQDIFRFFRVKTFLLKWIRFHRKWDN